MREPADDEARDIARWLGEHSELVAIEADPIEGFGYGAFAYATATQAVHCVEWKASPEAARRSWCWQTGREISTLTLVRGDFASEEAGPILLGERTGTDGVVRALRFPEGEWVVVPGAGAAPEPEDARRPIWYPVATKRRRAGKPRAQVPKVGWAALTLVRDPLAPGAIAGRKIRPVLSLTPGLAAIEVSNGLDEDLRVVTCARWRERWACSASRESGPEFMYDRVQFAYVVGSGDEQKIALQHVTQLDGGHGEFSGASGEAWLELLTIEGRALRSIAALQIGGIEWLVLPIENRASYDARWTKRYYHPHGPRGAGCVALESPRYEQVEADGGFRTIRRLKRQREVFSLWPVPDTLTPVDGRYRMPHADDPPASLGNEVEEMEQPLASWVLTGLWRVGADGSLTRIAADPAASCPES